jgi:hypothetical protein
LRMQDEPDHLLGRGRAIEPGDALALCHVPVDPIDAAA